MAILPGGITSRPVGKCGAQVYGKARTRYGKLTTAREYEIPSNPNTPEQQIQRGIFQRASRNASLVGATEYQTAWNNTVGLLPGWNALVKYGLDNIVENAGQYSWSTSPFPKSLGPCFMPEITFGTPSGGGEIRFEWTDETPGDWSAGSDTLHGWLSRQDSPGQGGSGLFLMLPGTTTRSNKFLVVDGLDTAEDYFYTLWFEHVPVEGERKYSPVANGIATASGT